MIHFQTLLKLFLIIALLWFPKDLAYEWSLSIMPAVTPGTILITFYLNLNVAPPFVRSDRLFFVSAFNKTMDRLHKYGKSLKEFNYNNKEIADDIYSAINSTQFLGISVSHFIIL